MGRVRTLIYGSVVGAALGVVFAPRVGGSRRAAADRLRLALRPGRGAGAAFLGTPCSTVAHAGAADTVPGAGPGPAGGGHDDG